MLEQTIPNHSNTVIIDPVTPLLHLLLQME